MKAYIDSDVLIWHLRGERKALNLLKRLRDDQQFEVTVQRAWDAQLPLLSAGKSHRAN